MSRQILLATLGNAKRNRPLIFNLAAGGDDVELLFTFWILRDERSTILIDTGFPERVARARGVHEHADSARILEGNGIDPGDIGTIIVSHLHWDHFAAPERFPNATFIVQNADVEYFEGAGREHPAGTIADAQSLDALADLRAQDRLRIIEGTVRLAPDLQVVLVGGHTPGMQVTVLEGPAGPTVFACDASHLYENLTTRTPTSIIYNYADYQTGFRLVESLATGGRWFPGHDPKMIEGLERAGDRLYRVPV